MKKQLVFFLLAALFVAFVVILMLVFRSQSIKMQEQKEIRIIQEQRAKEEAIIEQQTKQRQQEVDDKVMGLNACLESSRLNAIDLSIVLGLYSPAWKDDLIAKRISIDTLLSDDYFKKTRCSNLRTEEACLTLKIDANKRVNESSDKSKEDCYTRYQ